MANQPHKRIKKFHPDEKKANENENHKIVRSTSSPLHKVTFKQFNHRIADKYVFYK